MLGKTIYLSDNPNDFVWSIPEGKGQTFERLIHAYLRKWVATRDGRVKVSKTGTTRDSGRDFEIRFSGETELFGLHFASHNSTGFIFVECKSTKNERLDDEFIVDASQHTDAQALAYILVTIAVVTPNCQQRAQTEWRRRDSESKGPGPVGIKHIRGMKPSLASVAIISLLLFGCDLSRRPLSNRYYLERYDEGGTSYYVIDPGSRNDGGGVFDGTVEEVGWNQDWILARVKKLYHGDPSGWFALNLQSNQISGPFKDTELQANPNFAKIKLMQPADVFSSKR